MSVKINIEELKLNKYGMLSIIKEVESYVSKAGNKYRQVLCKCDCGGEITTPYYNLRGKQRVDCGCVKKEKSFISQNTSTRLYKIWYGMKYRCLSKKYNGYENYGGRGITICDDWVNDFVVFYDWSIKNGYNDILTLDRINTNGNYEPNNCRWTTKQIQASNRRIGKNNKLGYTGVSYCEKSKKYTGFICFNGSRYTWRANTLKEAVEKRNNFIRENKLMYKIQEFKDQQLTPNNKEKEK